MPERVLIAMSGGVDSSVAAARLVRQGFDVVGVTLHLWDYPRERSSPGRCCAPEDIHDARRVCDALGIAHFAFDRRELFRREVVDPFVEGYLNGLTPSPCVRCNRGVKMQELFALAERLSATRVATGHYARVDHTDSVPRLLRAKDRNKDQSYFLHMLPSKALARLVFPLGTASKAEVRAEAVELGLPGASKGESQELCFVQTERYDALVDQRAPGRARPGHVVDEQGNLLREHDGIHRFTLGQRKNLGVAGGRRLYVIGVDPDSATVQLGSREQLESRHALLSDLALAQGVSLPLDCEVAVRYRGQLHSAVVTARPEGAHVEFASAVQAVVPGQVAVFYDGERVLGGGTIVRKTLAQNSTQSVQPS